MSGRPRWNLLAGAGTELPPNLLLAAKLLVVALVAKGYAAGLPEVFLPFLAPLERLDPVVFRHCLQGAFAAAAVALFLHHQVRAAAVVLGLVLLAGVLASKPQYRNATVYAGCVLLLIGLHTPGRSPWLLRAQIALLYLGAGMNKLLDPDWRSGQYMEHWLVRVLTNPYYEEMTTWLPPGRLSLALGWTAILVELFVGAAILARPTRPAAIWTAATLHLATLLMTHQDFGIFLIAILASFLAAIDWPRSVTVSAASARAGTRLVRALAARLDLDGLVRWEDAPTPTDRLVVCGERGEQWRLTGLEALARLLLLFPPVLFLLVALVAGPKWVRWWSALLAFLCFTPWRSWGRRVVSRVSQER